MNNIKNVFTIIDIENITGIKAHTIRIWEKRYGILDPDRLARNVRTYTMEELQKILNISVLYHQGHKISKIAKLTNEELFLKTRELTDEAFLKNKALAELKICMLNFDSELFDKLYADQMMHKSFSQVFQELFVPFLHFLGLMWHTDLIKPAHEHFISNLIYQKIQANAERMQTRVDATSPTYILYLPDEEMHEIGILYLNYELKLRGFKTIYLGRCIPFEDLLMLKNKFKRLIFISHFTVYPTKNEVESYLSRVQEELLSVGDEYWAISAGFDAVQKIGDVQKFQSLKDLVPILNQNV